MLLNTNQTNTQSQVGAITNSTTTAYNGKKRGPKPKKEPTAQNVGAAGSVSSPKLNQKQLIAQQQKQQLQAQHSQFLMGQIKPTILTMDANSQIIIDFNQNDDLLCTYCDYTINNLNYMRTHIKYKHKNGTITFKNKFTSKYYTIVEWPLTPVPTLTPAGSIPPIPTTNEPQPTQPSQSTSTGTTATTNNPNSTNNVDTSSS